MQKVQSRVYISNLKEYIYKMSLKRISIKFGGESGQGIKSIGDILANTLNEHGYEIFASREYPSLIKGGVASYQIDLSNKTINSSLRNCDILLIFDKDSFNQYLETISPNGILIYDCKDLTPTEEQLRYLKDKNIDLIFLDSKELAKTSGGTEIMSNVVMLGFLWKILNLDIELLTDQILDFFKHKNIDIEAEKACILSGYNSHTYRPELSKRFQLPRKQILKQKSKILTGNKALALSAISAGVRAYYAYPMTPATSIFKFLGETSKETGILVKQAENEITAVQMALGSMYMGTRALVATSGGGFDLMVETVSCSAISETPLVIILSQRTGAGTGVPTWTGAGDLNTALKTGHGDFPRCILAVSDVQSSYTLLQSAFNIAEKYQIPTILLTEKQISEGTFSVKGLPKNLPIQRSFNQGENRYQITDSGISPRWIPSKDSKPYLHNSDEHTQDGTSTEDSKEIIEMADKRQRKLQTLLNEIPEPKIYGNTKSKNVFVGWGSVKNAITDTLDIRDDFAYLHFEYIYPLQTKTLQQLINEDRNLILIENNQTGQLGELITKETGYQFKEKILKYDGRPFYADDIIEYLEGK